jgi:acetyltransferase-like isoleucine patch superfamily enzyme
MSYIKENWFVGLKNRLLQEIARKAPGAMSLRPLLHRWRGVEMEKNVWIGYDAVVETAHPELVTIKEGAVISIQVLILAHFGGWERRVVIERNAFLGPRVIVLPNVVIGEGSVVAAGSVVTQSVPPMTMVQGNPAKPLAQEDEPT